MSRSLPLFIVSLFAVTLPLAGCLGGTDAPPAAPADENVTKDSALPSGDRDVAEVANATPRAMKVHPVEIAGTTGSYACAILLVNGHCVDAQPSTGDRIVDLAEDGRPVRLAGEVTFKASTPASEGMCLYLLERDGEDYEFSDAVEGFIECGSTSPLKIEFDLTSIPPGTALSIGVNGDGQSVFQCVPVGCAGVFGRTNQDYAFKGEYTSA